MRVAPASRALRASSEGVLDVADAGGGAAGPFEARQAGEARAEVPVGALHYGSFPIDVPPLRLPCDFADPALADDGDLDLAWVLQVRLYLLGDVVGELGGDAVVYFGGLD